MKLYIAAIFGLLLYSCSKHRAPDSLTASKILRVELGMSKDEVIDILGEPIIKSVETFQFTEEYDYNYPMLWVHFDSLGVREVYAKYYDWFDDKGIYGISENKETGEEYRWGDQALKEYFK